MDKGFDERAISAELWRLQLLLPSPVPFDIATSIRSAAGVTAELVSRGWDLTDVDESGCGLTWPASMIEGAFHTDDMVTPVTLITVGLAGTITVLLAGQEHETIARDLDPLEVMNAALRLDAIEAYRFPIVHNWQ